MDEYESLCHTKWECKYHVVFIPKCRRKTLYAQLRKDLGEVFRRLAAQKESRIEDLGDHPKPAIEDHFKTGQRTITLDNLFYLTGWRAGKSSLGQSGPLSSRTGWMPGAVPIPPFCRTIFQSSPSFTAR